MTAQQPAVTVRALVAEVRVLMAGSRQVTRSVFRQLDSVDYDDIEPFGRVNENEGDWIVGRHRVTGDLVRADLRRDEPRALDRAEKWELRHLEEFSTRVEAQEGRYQRLARRHARWLRWRAGYDIAHQTYIELPLIVLAGLR